ncbi:MAG: YbdD/YjiX family protein [Gammaproteobacteria bacterium]|nr:YbdD/YjiX family protein [Gammaproteobacteria bacterium]
MRRALRRAWGALRAATGDDAYERYCRHQARHHPGAERLERAAFWAERERDRWSGVRRCC